MFRTHLKTYPPYSGCVCGRKMASINSVVVDFEMSSRSMRTNPKQTPLNRIEKPPLPDRGTAEDHLMRVRRIIYKAKLGDNGTQAHKDLRKRIRKMTRELAAYAAEQVKWTRNEYRGI